MTKEREEDQVYRAARDAYLEEHPKPVPEEFRCSRCGAGAGVPCTVRVRHKTVHRARSSLWARAFMRRQAAAIQAGDDAVNALYEERGR